MKQKSKKIVAVHLLNDFSGSPLVFSQALEGLQQAGYEVVLHTSYGRKGFLSGLKLKLVHFPYRFFSNTLLRIIAFFSSQFILFFQLLRYRNEDVTIYINTLLPFGAALAGKVMGKKVIYHLHESYIRPAILKRFLKKVAELSADTALYVSHYLQDSEQLRGVHSAVVYNALPDDFVRQSESFRYHPVHQDQFMVLMVCSLKIYKGIYEFAALAERHPKLHFEMVLNASEVEIAAFFSEENIPSNLLLHSTQTDMHPFYQRASLVVNLTNPSLCIETFGMTLLEAMCYGIPVIAPPVGGPAEIITTGKNGFMVDVRKELELDRTIETLSCHPEQCGALSIQAKKTAMRFRNVALRQQVLDAIMRD
ncbi:N/A [soil metagenome]